MGESRARLEPTERPSPVVYFLIKVYSVAANTSSREFGSRCTAPSWARRRR